MLQTRLFPYFLREGRRIMFAAAPAYLWLVRACLVGGIGGILLGFFGRLIGISLQPYPEWWVFTGGMVLAAGILAQVSLPQITFNVPERVYRRWEGIGSIGKQVHGKFDSLDAIVVTSHRNLGASLIAGGFAVEYRITLHWKGAVQPPLLLALDHRSIQGNYPPQSAAGPALALAQRVASGLGLRLYDNSHILA